MSALETILSYQEAERQRISALRRLEAAKREYEVADTVASRHLAAVRSYTQPKSKDE